MILCGGETLIDFIPVKASDGSLAYRPANGGSVHNVALALGRLGVPVGFVAGISTDFFGEALARRPLTRPGRRHTGPGLNGQAPYSQTGRQNPTTGG